VTEKKKRQKFVTALAPSVGYRGHAPIATSTEKRQRLDVRPMVWRNGTPCAHSEEKAQRNERPIQSFYNNGRTLANSILFINNKDK